MPRLGPSLALLSINSYTTVLRLTPKLQLLRFVPNKFYDYTTSQKFVQQNYSKLCYNYTQTMESLQQIYNLLMNNNNNNIGPTTNVKAHFMTNGIFHFYWHTQCRSIVG